MDKLLKGIEEVNTCYYINCGNYKLKRHGYFLSKDKKDLVCEVMSDNKKVVTHFSSGLKITECEDLMGDKELLKLCTDLLEEKKELVEARMLTVNLKDIPEISSIDDKLEEFETVFGFILPYDVLVYGLTGRYKLNVIDFENKLIRVNKDSYIRNKSLKWNIKNMYDDEAVNVCKLFL